jgi:hypothetical protein
MYGKLIGLLLMLGLGAAHADERGQLVIIVGSDAPHYHSAPHGYAQGYAHGYRDGYRDRRYGAWGHGQHFGHDHGHFHREQSRWRRETRTIYGRRDIRPAHSHRYERDNRRGRHASPFRQ